MKFPHYLRLAFILTIIGFLGSCSSKPTSTQEGGEKKDEIPFWQKKNANGQVNALLKKVQSALRQYRLKPVHLYDTTDVRNFLNDHKAYQGKVQIDTIQNGFIGTVYVSDDIELAMNRNAWGIIFKAKTQGNPNEIFLFTKNGWGVYALSGRSSDIGVWKNDVYYLDLNGRSYESDVKRGNLRARGTKYLKSHLMVLRQRKKRAKK